MTKVLTNITRYQSHIKISYILKSIKSYSFICFFIFGSLGYFSAAIHATDINLMISSFNKFKRF